MHKQLLPDEEQCWFRDAYLNGYRDKGKRWVSNHFFGEFSVEVGF